MTDKVGPPDPIVVVAGASGDLGRRITEHLVMRGASVRALLRVDASDDARQRVESLGAISVPADAADIGAAACEGADCVVSALSGLRGVVLDRQSVLIDAAARAQVPRFIFLRLLGGLHEDRAGAQPQLRPAPGVHGTR